MRVIRDVGGVDGLHLVLDAFSEEVERRLFESNNIHHPQAAGAANPQRHGKIQCPFTDPDLFRTCNIVRDSGLCADYITPDCAVAALEHADYSLACPVAHSVPSLFHFLGHRHFCHHVQPEGRVPAPL